MFSEGKSFYLDKLYLTAPLHRTGIEKLSQLGRHQCGLTSFHVLLIRLVWATCSMWGPRVVQASDKGASLSAGLPLRRCKLLSAVMSKWNRHWRNFAFLCLCSSMCLDCPVFNDLLKKWSSPQRWKSAVPIITPDRQGGRKPVIWTSYPRWVKLVACRQGNSELGFLNMSQCWSTHDLRNKPSEHQNTWRCVRSCSD